MTTIVITGAGRGIGLALTKLFLQRGDNVVATFRDAGAERLLRSLGSQSQLSLCQLEVTDSLSIKNFVAQLSNGVIDVLINNAGIMGPAAQGLYDMDKIGWEETFRVNAIAPFELATALLPNLEKSGNPRVVTISSQMGSLHRKSTGSFAYRSSKAAVNKIMQVMATELEDRSVIVCPVHPGWVRTEMGGPAADIGANESAAGLVSLINSLTMEHSGRFWTWQGKEHLW